MTSRRAVLANRYCAFLIVITLSALSPLWPHHPTPASTWWAIGGGLIVVMVALGGLAYRLGPTHWLHTVAPLLMVPIVQCLRATDGNAASGFTPLLVLPVAWFALDGRRRDMYLAIGGSLLVLFAPLIFIGAPQYPERGWRSAALWAVVLLMIGPIIQRLVSSSQRASRALEQSEARFRAAFETVPVGMAIVGATGENSGIFIRVNDALARMLGRDQQDLVGRPVSEFTHRDDQHVTQTALQADVRSLGHRIEKRYMHPSGKSVWAGIIFSHVLDDHGEPLYFVSQIEDIGARRVSEQALRDVLIQQRAATERLNELDKARSDLVSTVSHELRTPLAGAAGYVELLADGDAGPLTAEQRSMLDAVERNLARLNGIVGDLLSLSRLDDESGLPDAVAVGMGKVVSDAAQTVSIMAATRGQHLTLDSALEGVEVTGDADKLERALVNLLSNAVKYTPEDGRIDVRAYADARVVCIEVTDTGLGIAPEDHYKIFERFYRSTMVRDRSIAGTGLGLAIVKSIATQHGGTIGVRSSPGAGSTFTLTVPRRTAP